MKLTNYIINFLAQDTLSIWAGNSNAKLKSDLGRSLGIKISEDQEHLTVFVSDAYISGMDKNVSENPMMAIFISNMINYESYQFKGTVIELHASSDSESAFQK